MSPRRVFAMAIVPMTAASVFAMSNVAVTANAATPSASSVSPNRCWYLPKAMTVCCTTPTGTVCYVS